MPTEELTRQFHVRVAPQRLMILIQLDKPIFKPTETIKYRVLLLNQNQMMMDTHQHVVIRIQVIQTLHRQVLEMTQLLSSNCLPGYGQ